MSLHPAHKREYLYQSGMKTHHWIHYSTEVVLEGEGGFLSVWTQRDPATYTGYGIILGDLLYGNDRPYEGE